ncbi:hypothetical protein ACP4OV_003842 [Aristida adscensionis]
MSSPLLAGCYSIKCSFYPRKYLRYVRRQGELEKVLHLSGEDAISPSTRFYVEPSEVHEGLVHIRCCYNNTYWVPRRVKDDISYIFCDASTAEEDLSNPSCTLFKVYLQLGFWRIAYKDDQSRIHPWREYQDHVSIWEDGCLVRENTSVEFSFIAVDKPLPRHVRFKGDNNEYLGTVDKLGGELMKFDWRHPGPDNLSFTIHPNKDGTTFRVQADKGGKFWTASHTDRWIRAAAGDDSSRDDYMCHFQVDSWLAGSDGKPSTVTIKNFYENKLLKRLDEGKVKSGLAAATYDAADPCTKLVVEEAVSSRRIYNVRYHREDVRVHTQAATTKVEGESFSNLTSSVVEVELKVRFESNETSSWEASVTATLSATGTVQAGFPKLGLGASLEIHSELNASYTMGKSSDHTEERTVTSKVLVKPMTKVAVFGIRSEATFDLPFSYDQEDTFPDGHTRVHRDLQDGIFRGIGGYIADTYFIETPLDSKDKNFNSIPAGN